MKKINYKYLSGNAFKSICKYSCGHYTSAREHHFNFKVRDDIENNYVFIKTEYTFPFFEHIHLDFPFTVITHNSDEAIDERFRQFIDHPLVEKWYGQNINLKHHKLESVPIGLANPKWAHGNPDAVSKVIRESQPATYRKTSPVYVNFDIGTNPQERLSCLEETGLQNADTVDFPTYLNAMSESYFAVSPNGNGIDCHKHWEALYLKTIPIVTKSVNMDFYKDMPFLVLNDWSELKNITLSKELYESIWKDFNPDTILFPQYVNKKGLG